MTIAFEFNCELQIYQINIAILEREIAIPQPRS